MEIWNGGDGAWREGGPRSDLANVPPEVLGIAVADVDVELAHKRRGGICAGEIAHESGGRASWKE